MAQSKERFNWCSITIKSEEIEKINTTSFEGAIASKAAGVQVIALKVVLILHSKLELEAVRQ